MRCAVEHEVGAERFGPTAVALPPERFAQNHDGSRVHNIVVDLETPAEDGLDAEGLKQPRRGLLAAKDLRTIGMLQRVPGVDVGPE